MDLSTAQQVLVIFLSTILAIFLILSVVAIILFIRLLQTLRMVANKAERFVESAEAVGDVFRKAAGPLGVFKFIRGLVDLHHKQNNNDKE